MSETIDGMDEEDGDRHEFDNQIRADVQRDEMPAFQRDVLVEVRRRIRRSKRKPALVAGAVVLCLTIGLLSWQFTVDRGAQVAISGIQEGEFQGSYGDFVDLFNAPRLTSVRFVETHHEAILDSLDDKESVDEIR